MTKQILMINASLLKESSCRLRTYYTLVRGYKAPQTTNDVQYGSAVHEFIKQMKLNGGNMHKALPPARLIFNKPCIQKTMKKWMTEQHFIKDCMDYWDQMGDPKDEWITCTNLVEQKFAVPYLITDTHEVILVGTIDDVCQRGNNGMFAIRDYKTTTMGYNADTYLAGYRLDPQLKFYYFVLMQYAKTYPESVFASMFDKGVGCFIRGIFLQSTLDKELVIKDSEVFQFKEKDMLEFKLMLDEKIQEIIKLSTQMPPPDGILNGACKTVYGPCKYHNACGAVDEFARDHVLSHTFIQKPYDPLNME